MSTPAKEICISPSKRVKDHRMRGISVNLRPQNHSLESFPPTNIHRLFLRTEQTFTVTLLKLKSYQAPECCWPEFEIRPVELLLRQNQFWRWIPTDWRHYLLPCLTLWNVTGLLILGDASPLLLYVGHAFMLKTLIKNSMCTGVGT